MGFKEVIKAKLPTLAYKTAKLLNFGCFNHVILNLQKKPSFVSVFR
jgi:hypothetical protein